MRSFWRSVVAFSFLAVLAVPVQAWHPRTHAVRGHAFGVPVAASAWTVPMAGFAVTAAPTPFALAAPTASYALVAPTTSYALTVPTSSFALTAPVQPFAVPTFALDPRSQTAEAQLDLGRLGQLRDLLRFACRLTGESSEASGDLDRRLGRIEDRLDTLERRLRLRTPGGGGGGSGGRPRPDEAPFDALVLGTRLEDETLNEAIDRYARRLRSALREAREANQAIQELRSELADTISTLQDIQKKLEPEKK